MNIVRHAGASSVNLQADLLCGQLLLRVVDDGIGLISLQQTRGRGLQNMQRRLLDMGGRVTLGEHESPGTTLVFEIPITEQRVKGMQTA